MKKTRLLASILSLTLSLTSLTSITSFGDTIETDESAVASSDIAAAVLAESQKIKNTVKEYIEKTGADIIPVEYYWEYDFSTIDEDAMSEAEKFITLRTGYKKGTDEFNAEVKKKYIELTKVSPDIGYTAQKKRLLDSIGFSKEISADIIGDSIQQMNCELTVEQINKAAELEQTWSINTPMKYIAGPKEEELPPPSELPFIDGLSDSEKIDKTVKEYISRTGEKVIPGYICWVYDYSEIDEEAMLKAIEYVDSLNMNLTVSQRQSKKNAKYLELTMENEKYSYRTQEKAIYAALGLDENLMTPEKNTNGRIFYDLTTDIINSAAEHDQVTLIAVPQDIVYPENTTGPANADIITTTTTTVSTNTTSTDGDITTTAVSASTQEKFEETNFFVVVGTYGAEKYTQLRYYYPQYNGEYTADKVIWKEAPDGLSYGDVFIADGDVSMTKVQAAPNNPAYAMSYYYQLDDGAKLKKVGNCNDIMEKNDLTVTSVMYDGSSHFSIKYKSADRSVYSYGLSTYGSSLSVNPADCEEGDVFTFALYKGNAVLPLSKNSKVNDDADSIGDANCNGRVDMSDAVLIMQSIANPSKYKLTDQGRKNADMGGDGITSGDALAIQKKLLKLD